MGKLLLVVGSLVHCRILSNIPSVHSLNAGSSPPGCHLKCLQTSLNGHWGPSPNRCWEPLSRLLNKCALLVCYFGGCAWEPVIRSDICPCVTSSDPTQVLSKKENLHTFWKPKARVQDTITYHSHVSSPF